MRLAYLTVGAMLFYTPALASEPNGTYGIGNFNVNFRGETMALISDTSDSSEASDLYFSGDQDTSGKT